MFRKSGRQEDLTIYKASRVAMLFLFCWVANPPSSDLGTLDTSDKSCLPQHVVKLWRMYTLAPSVVDARYMSPPLPSQTLADLGRGLVAFPLRRTVCNELGFGARAASRMWGPRGRPGVLRASGMSELPPLVKERRA